MRFSSAIGLLAFVGLTIGAPHPSSAGLIISGVVGGSSTGAIQENFDSLFPGNDAPTTLPSGITIYYVGDAGPVSGSVPDINAAPYLSGGNGLGFGPSGSTQANGVDGTTYITAGSAGSVTLQFPTLETYLGILWGSVDGYNSLSLYNGTVLIGTLTGSDVLTSPNGDQGVNGTAYVNISATGGSAFDRAVAASGLNAFEFDDVSFNLTVSTFAADDPVPEPVGVALFGTGLLALAFMRRR
jgi:hypothetical protein